MTVATAPPTVSWSGSREISDMRRRAIALALVMVCAATAARGQHAEGTLGEWGCDLCHGPHSRGSPGAYNLKTTDVSVWLGSGLVGGLGAVSRSCLRCHVSVAMRERQPEVTQRQLVGASSGSYLGFDLSGHHPVGRIDLTFRSGLPRGGGAARPTVGLGALGDDRIECTRCHDPHDRAGSLPRQHEQSALCGQCHDAGAYLLGHESVACSDCHRLHRGAPGPLLKGASTELLCRSCHDPAMGSPAISMVPALRLPEAHAGLGHAASSGRCETCHEVHR
jgi:predicted CXXCH cytochrome family protein